MISTIVQSLTFITPMASNKTARLKVFLVAILDNQRPINQPITVHYIDNQSAWQWPFKDNQSTHHWPSHRPQNCPSLTITQTHIFQVSQKVKVKSKHILNWNTNVQYTWDSNQHSQVFKARTMWMLSEVKRTYSPDISIQWHITRYHISQFYA